MKLLKYQDYSRKDVHDIFDPTSNFIPQRGTWGFQGIIQIPDRENDYVFFVTLGRVEGHHTFDEGVTIDGILKWQSQPQQTLTNKRIQKFINHDHNVNNIYLFLRTNGRKPAYTYLGKLGYISHDTQREKPVYFKWQILDWELSEDQAQKIGLELEHSLNSNTTTITEKVDSLEIVEPPIKSNHRSGERTNEFRGKHVNFDESNRLNKNLGNLGEILVLQHEKDFLLRNGKPELAKLVEHTSVTEGDGAGYDIKSYTIDGDVKYIEVKTTRGNINTPFYLSLRELMFSKQHQDSYFLYRVYDYDEQNNNGKMFIINGNLEEKLTLDPLIFKARIF